MLYLCKHTAIPPMLNLYHKLSKWIFIKSIDSIHDESSCKQIQVCSPWEEESQKMKAAILKSQWWEKRVVDNCTSILCLLRNWERGPGWCIMAISNCICKGFHCYRCIDHRCRILMSVKSLWLCLQGTLGREKNYYCMTLCPVREIIARFIIIPASTLEQLVM